MDKMYQEEYTERDLEGLKVSHDFEDMNEGEARILTLKDSRILDNEEDVLQNVEMAEEERRKKNQELKIKRRDYTGYDDEEFAEGQQGMKRSVLSKYDEVINGTEEMGFRLGSNIVSKKVALAEQQKEEAVKVNKSLLSIDYLKNVETNDYLKEGDAGFKKPKNKKKRSSRRAAELDPDENDAMDVDQKPVARVRDLDANFVDDDDLQAALARSRKAKLHKTKKLTPEELARQIAQEREQESANAMDVIKVGDNQGEDSALTFDDTSEFIRAVGVSVKEVKEEEVSVKQRSPSRDVSMAPGDQALTEIEAGEVVVKEEEEEDDMAMIDAIEDALLATEAEERGGPSDALDVGGTSSEQMFSSGMASTINILRQQGLLATPSSDQKERERIQQQRDIWLADQRLRIAQRELARVQSRGGNKDQATREYENRLREQQEARDNMDTFKNYKPDINIVYYDEYGRALTPKEAWKALSHKFHGKGSGRAKTEKRLKKIAEEKKKAAMASGDTPLSMNAAFQQRQQKAGQAHFVLSVGNRGAVPQAAEFLDVQPLSKGKSERAKKKKDAKSGRSTDTGFITLPGHGAAESPGPATVEQNGSASPAPRPGFSRISSVAEPSSQGGTPAPERSKVAFGFGTKRKAGEEPEGTPPPKRR